MYNGFYEWRTGDEPEDLKFYRVVCAMGILQNPAVVHAYSLDPLLSIPGVKHISTGFFRRATHLSNGFLAICVANGFFAREARPKSP